MPSPPPRQCALHAVSEEDLARWERESIEGHARLQGSLDRLADVHQRMDALRGPRT